MLRDHDEHSSPADRKERARSGNAPARWAPPAKVWTIASAIASAFSSIAKWLAP
ncbi:MAG TPA: hypothetical protein VNZ26_35395 [Vicinamibacterales bacterium]|nr:hypothetical protein [Vicinamibacterales bacterium]